MDRTTFCLLVGLTVVALMTAVHAQDDTTITATETATETPVSGVTTDNSTGLEGNGTTTTSNVTDIGSSTGSTSNMTNPEVDPGNGTTTGTANVTVSTSSQEIPGGGNSTTPLLPEGSMKCYKCDSAKGGECDTGLDKEKTDVCPANKGVCWYLYSSASSVEEIGATADKTSLITTYVKVYRGCAEYDKSDFNATAKIGDIDIVLASSEELKDRYKITINEKSGMLIQCSQDRCTYGGSSAGSMTSARLGLVTIAVVGQLWMMAGRLGGGRP